MTSFVLNNWARKTKGVAKDEVAYNQLLSFLELFFPFEVEVLTCPQSHAGSTSKPVVILS